MRNTFREKYGSKLFAIVVIIMMVTVVYPTLITNAKNPSQLSAYDDDWNDISDFASDVNEEQNGKHEIKTIVSRPAIINKISEIEKNTNNQITLFMTRKLPGKMCSILDKEWIVPSLFLCIQNKRDFFHFT